MKKSKTSTVLLQMQPTSRHGSTLLPNRYQSTHHLLCSHVPVLFKLLVHPLFQQPAQVIVRQVLGFKHSLWPHGDAFSLASLEPLGRGINSDAQGDQQQDSKGKLALAQTSLCFRYMRARLNDAHGQSAAGKVAQLLTAPAPRYRDHNRSCQATRRGPPLTSIRHLGQR